MRPLPSKNFGASKNKLAVKFYDGGSVVTGFIVKQLGNKRFLVQNGNNTSIRMLAQNAADITAMTGGDLTICAIEFTPYGGSLTYVASIANKTLVAHDGVRYSYLLAVAATDASQGALAVVANHAPTVAAAAPDQTGTVGALFTYTVAAGTFADLDGDALTLTATLQNGSALPGWLTFDAPAGTLSGTPTGAGTVLVRITATDGSASVNDDFTITIS